MLKKKWRDLIVIAVCLAAVVATIIWYSLFASAHIVDESSEHLYDMAGQVNAKFSQSVDTNRNLLYSWRHYINESVDIIYDKDNNPEAAEARERELNRFLSAQDKQWGFSDIYLIGETETYEEDASEGAYRYVADCRSWLENKPVKLRVRRSLKSVVEENKGAILGTVEGEDKQILLFAVGFSEEEEDGSATVHKYEYKGFKYYALGISFDTDDMRRLLTVDAFGGTGICYVVMPSGSVILQAGSPHEKNITNYITFLGDKKQVALENKRIEEIGNDWQNQKSDTVLFTDKTVNVKYYLTYQPTGFNDWMFLGIVPRDYINGSMNRFRTVTIAVMTLIFALVGAAVAWMVISRNRGKVKEKEREVSLREQLFDLLTLNSNDIFVLFSIDDFKAEYVSANISQVLGLDIEDVRKDVHKILSASVKQFPAFTSQGLKALPMGRTWEIDMQMKHVENQTLYWYHMALYHETYNNIDSCIMVFSDRTKEHQMAESLESALDIAKSANEAKSNFLSNMSHDIRTPMNAIIGFSTLLAKDADKPDKVREYVRKISFSGQHLLGLINDILDMSKIESGKTTLNIEEFNLSEMLEEIYAMMASQTKAKLQTFDVHTKGHLPDYVMGDKLRINQILLNILSNAMKYTPEKGAIELCVEALENNIPNHAHLRIEVKDNGVGMSEEFIKEIFDPFAREITAKTKGIQGTGLGMAITKNIVDLMGGTISVESELNKGSTFIVELELALGKQPDADDAEFWTKHNVTRVLVVDDEEDICVNVKDLMEDTGVDVQYALSGKRAIEMVSAACDENRDYHIILIDWKMPEMDGVETAKRIRAKVGKGVPIMVLTSYNFDEIEEEAKKAGIDLFLPKPFFVSNFRHAIEKLRGGDTKELESVPEKISLAGLKVLAAEDNEINAEILAELLDVEEVQCDIASNGKEALEKFQASDFGRYDMIFMDVQMPIMNGYDATRAIRVCGHPQAKTIPIIAMTANAFDDDVKQALDSGMNAHLAKPIDMDKLKVIISGLRDKQNNPAKKTAEKKPAPKASKTKSDTSKAVRSKSGAQKSGSAAKSEKDAKK